MPRASLRTVIVECLTRRPDGCSAEELHEYAGVLLPGLTLSRFARCVLALVADGTIERAPGADGRYRLIAR